MKSIKTPYSFILVIFLLFPYLLFSQSGGVSISPDGTEPHESAALDVNFDNKGFLLPRMTEEQRDGINNPAVSLIIFNLDSNCFETYVLEEWHSLWCPEEESEPIEPFECGSIFTDIRDNNEYQTVLIGEQCWMAENLKYLPEGQTFTAEGFGSSSESRYYVHGFNSGGDMEDLEQAPTAFGNYNTYGILYNWLAAMGEDTPVNMDICPEGWTLASDDDWKILEGFVDSEFGIGHEEWDGTGWRGNDAGEKLKTNIWGGNNESGFTGLPGGFVHSSDQQFYSLGASGYWWTSSETSGTHAYRRYIHIGSFVTVNRISSWKISGFSVRCIKE